MSDYKSSGFGFDLGAIRTSEPGNKRVSRVVREVLESMEVPERTYTESQVRGIIAAYRDLRNVLEDVDNSHVDSGNSDGVRRAVSNYYENVPQEFREDLQKGLPNLVLLRNYAEVISSRHREI